jgi:hypothetical protein
VQLTFTPSTSLRLKFGLTIQIASASVSGHITVFHIKIHSRARFGSISSIFAAFLFLGMSISLDRLPFDVFFQIAESLHVDDVVHLGQTCRHLKALLDESTLYRCLVEV